jgi:hypothetical protein
MTSALIAPSLKPGCNSARHPDELKERAEQSYARARAEGGERLAKIWSYTTHQLIERDNPIPFTSNLLLARVPVTIEEFVESPDFLGNTVHVWPTLMADLSAMNPDVLAGEEPVHEAYLGGAAGIGKSMMALITTLYQVYRLTCFRDPHRLYGLDPQTRFVFPLQSVSPEVTRRVLYEPLRDMFEAMPYAERNLRWNKHKRSALELEGGIHVVPAPANVEHLLGQAIPGAVLDEVNFLRIVERSKRVPGPRGLGGYYDQAEELYRELSQRRRSRFAGNGVSIGCIVVSSSARYQNDFLDRRIQEVEATGAQNVVITRHKRYDIVPQDRYCGETFRLLVGTERYPTRILREDESAPEGATVEHVPIEHEDEFRRDPEFALRAIVGVAVDSITPFISEREKIVEAVEHGEARGLEHWVDKPDVVLERDGLPRWSDAAIPDDRDAARFVHIDLSRTRNACGIAVVKYLGMAEVRDPDTPETVLAKPRFAVEAAISIKPSPDTELNFSDLRGWLMQLVNRHGLEIHMISMDGYQSTDAMQIFRRRGIRTRDLSVDSSPEPYEHLRECLHEGRIAMVDSPTLRRELIQLERNPKTGLVDHPPRGSKDVADAVCGAIHAAASSRSIRGQAGYYDREGRPKRIPRPRPQPKRPPGRRRS